MTINKFGGLLLVSLLCLLTSCDNNRVFEENQAILKEGWEITDVLKFSADIQDTVSAHSIYLNVRNSGDYKWSNLYVFVKTTAPNGATIRDTVNLPLADERGRWLGRGFGSIWDNQIPYRTNIRFPYPGIYVFEVQHGMRERNLKCVNDFGIRIERD